MNLRYLLRLNSGCDAGPKLDIGHGDVDRRRPGAAAGERTDINVMGMRAPAADGNSRSGTRRLGALFWPVMRTVIGTAGNPPTAAAISRAVEIVVATPE